MTIRRDLEKLDRHEAATAHLRRGGLAAQHPGDEPAA